MTPEGVRQKSKVKSQKCCGVGGVNGGRWRQGGGFLSLRDPTARWSGHPDDGLLRCNVAVDVDCEWMAWNWKRDDSHADLDDLVCVGRGGGGWGRDRFGHGRAG